MLKTQFLHFQHYTLSPAKDIIPDASLIIIKLESNAEFRLDGNMFAGNPLNRITIQGNKRETVEISPHAFYGTRGPYPEIDIINVHSVVIHNNSFFGKFN